MRNICLNFQERPGPPMSIKQLYEPANVYALELDHDYESKCLSEKFLDSVYADSDKLEEKTRDQNNSTLWKEERTVRLTASNFGRICKATDRTDKSVLAHSYTQISDIKSGSLAHGRKFESVALKAYESTFKTKVSKCGLYVHPVHPYIAATPDGIAEQQILLEIKCPKTAYKKPINQLTVPYLKLVDGKLMLSTQHDYFYQVQGDWSACGNRYAGVPFCCMD